MCQSDIDYYITLNGSTIETDSNTSVVNGSIIKITEAGTYKVSGNLNDGYIQVEVADSDKVTLILDNVEIESKNFAAIYLTSADKLYLELQGDNVLKNTNSFVQIDDNNVDGAIYAKDDLCIKGEGNLEVSSSLNGIVAKDDLKLVGSGNININSNSHGIDANDSVRIKNQNITIISNKDGIHVENNEDTTKGYFYMESGNLDITAKLDGIDSSSYIFINDGEINIDTRGNTSSKYSSSSESNKGLKASLLVQIDGGNIEINSLDDAIHSNNNLTINNGEIKVSSGDDGFHADNILTINDGRIEINESYEGIEATTLNFNGGNIKVVSTDDGINASGGANQTSPMTRPGMGNYNSGTGVININGGNIIVDSKGDGIDANGSINMTGGFVIVYGPTDNGNGALDYDSSFTLTGGTLCALGSSGMAQNVSSASQCTALVSFNQNAGSGSKFEVKSGNNIIFEIELTKSCNTVVFSSSELGVGNTYSFILGSSTKSVSFTNYIYGSSQGQMTPGGGRPGGYR